MEETKREIVDKRQFGKDTYGNGPIFKTIMKITFPVFILMLVNSLYQLVDSLLAANLVEYAGESAHWTGAQTATMIMPIFAFAMAVTILTSFGFGTIYAQKLGAGDEKGAIEAQSTAFWGTVIVNIFLLVFIFLVTPHLVDFLMGSVKSEEIRSDAIMSAYVYTIVIVISSFQGVLSRTLRTEGHIKSMSYIPLISIPINIFFDIVFMKWVGMGVVGAALASMIALTITFSITIGYTLYAKKKEQTHFRISNLKAGINFKLLGFIVFIGLTPFLMQILRSYSFTVNLFMIKDITNSISTETYTQWMAFFSAATRPMTLILMPAMAVMQSGAAFLGYNYGAKDYKRVNKGVESMAVAMVIFALPQYIILLIITKYLLLGFGVTNEVINSGLGNDMLLMHRTWTAVSILSMSQGLTLIYLMSTKRNKYAVPLIVWNQFIVFTVVYVSFYLGFRGDEVNYWHFFFANPTSAIILSVSSISLLIGVIIPDNIRLKKMVSEPETQGNSEI